MIDLIASKDIIAQHLLYHIDLSQMLLPKIISIPYSLNWQILLFLIVCSRHEPYLNRYCLTMDTSHSVCLNVDWLIFLKNRINLWDYRQAFTRFKHDFFKVCGNVNLRHFPTQGGVTLLVSTCNFVALMWFFVLVADV